MRVFIPETDDELLQECTVETMRASGSGGQHVNTTDSAVRITHLQTGITIKVQQSRSQHQNKVLALELLRAKLEKLNEVKKPRIKTRRSKSAKQKILSKKKKHSSLKESRKKVNY